MGAGAAGKLLDWQEAKDVADEVRFYGVEQLLALWQRTKDRIGDPLLWGDEIEGLLVSFNDEKKQFTPYLEATEVAQTLNQAGQDREASTTTDTPWPHFNLEGGSFNLETTPGKPWGNRVADLLDVESDMVRRRSLVRSHLTASQCFITMAHLPGLGARDGKEVGFNRRLNGVQRSQFLPDNLISPHERYQKFAANLRERRGRNVAINVPVYRDEKTPWPFHDPSVDFLLHDWPEDKKVNEETVRENHVYCDAFMFSGHCCALQATIQAKDVGQARHLYDQLLPFGPIMLALTAATPTCKGYLADTDNRWHRVSSGMDDRTPEEAGEILSSPSRHPLKPRMASNSTFISQDPRLFAGYLQPGLPINEGAKKRLVESGMDDLLATHFAHLFIRDPFIIYQEDMERVDLEDTTHFEMLQSTNWQTLRFKPPVSAKPQDPGWRVEFRSMEVQFTDFENAAFVIFIVLLTQTILYFDLNFYIPIPKIDENMEIANIRDAVSTERFYFREHPFSDSQSELFSIGSGDAPHSSNGARGIEHEYQLMTINEIINGQASSVGLFPGLLPLIRRYLKSRDDFGTEEKHKLEPYLSLVERRANGSLWTAAKWQRNFVRQHPDYKKDSFISEQIAFDLMETVRKISEAEDRTDAGFPMLGRR